MAEVWLDLINPVDVSTDPSANQGSIVGGADALRTDDGDSSYVEVSNGYDQEEIDGWRDGGFSKTFQVDLEPDPSLPASVLDYGIGWVLTLRMVSPGTGGNVQRDHATGFQIIGSTASTSYVEDSPRGSTVEGPTWDQIRNGGWSHPFRGSPRNLLQSPWSLIRITRMRLWVTYAEDVPPPTTSLVAPPLRQYPRTDGLATSSARRLYPVSRSRQGSLRHGGGTYL